MKLRWLALGLLISVLACGGDNESSTVAKLIEVLAPSAEKSKDTKSWSLAAEGDRFAMGHAVRTGPSGRARLDFVGQPLRMGPSTTVFFGSERIQFDGEIETSSPTMLDLDIGAIELTSDGRIRVTRNQNRLSFAVLVGQATITDGDEQLQVQAGQTLDFEIGEGSVERIGPTDAGVADAAPSLEASKSPITASVKGRGVKIRRPDQKAWEDLRPGDHELVAETALKLQRRNTVKIARDTEEVTLSGPAEAVVDGNEQLLRIQSGVAAVTTSNVDLVIAVPGGRILVRGLPGSGSATDLAVRKQETKIIPTRGISIVTSDTGISERLQLGERLELDAAGGMVVRDRAPTNAQISLETAATLTIHDIHLPAAVRIDFSKHCPQGAVELARGGSFRAVKRLTVGEGSAIVELDRGSHLYRVRCLVDGELDKSPAHTGRIVIQRDSAARPLPKKAPRNTIDADGRRYTILYQNRLPALTFQWKKLAGGGTLFLQPDNGKSKSYKVEGKSKAMESGTIREGNYMFWFEAGGATSPKTRLAIGFDNAASSGYISTPAPSATFDTKSVRVAGAVVRGWTVSVAGQALRLDEQFRFDQVVPVSDDGTIAVRFAHPEHGVHYYLRGQKKAAKAVR